MGKSEKSHKRCQKYLAERRRIKNKTRKQKKRIKTVNLEAQKQILEYGKIGRGKEKNNG